MPKTNSSFLFAVQKELEKTIVGQKDLIEQMLVGFLSEGHLLLNGVPGLAKTLLIKSLAKAFDLSFNRIQFTPDLMPSDIVGYDVFEEKGAKKNFRFVEGPIFSQILLADEINRSPAKTQSALLQAMEEKEVTLSGHKYPLQTPFMVLATQNPFEQEGTYVLPEAQLDRFMFMLQVTYPSLKDETKIACLHSEEILKEVKPVVSLSELNKLKKTTQQIQIAPEVIEWLVKVIRKTRPLETTEKMIKDYVRLGASPRACKFAIKAAKVSTFLENKQSVEKHHLAKVLYPILRHRLLLNYNSQLDQVSADQIIAHLISTPL